MRDIEACQKRHKALDIQLIKAIEAGKKAQEDVEDQKNALRVLRERDVLLKEKEEWTKSKDGYSDELYAKALADAEGKISAKAAEEKSAEKVPAVVSPTKKRRRARQTWSRRRLEMPLVKVPRTIKVVV